MMTTFTFSRRVIYLALFLLCDAHLLSGAAQQEPDTLPLAMQYGRALLEAANTGNSEALRAALNQLNTINYRGLNCVTRGECTALHCAAAVGSDKCCKMLLECPAFQGINELTDEGMTALHFAAQAGSVKCCQAILEKTIQEDPKVFAFTRTNQLDARGRLALHVCAARRWPSDADAETAIKMILRRTQPDLVMLRDRHEKNAFDYAMDVKEAAERDKLAEIPTAALWILRGVFNRKLVVGHRALVPASDTVLESMSDASQVL